MGRKSGQEKSPAEMSKASPQSESDRPRIEGRLA